MVPINLKTTPLRIGLNIKNRENTLMKKRAILLEQPFDLVAALYIKKVNIEKRNDIRARTKLRERYPELFDKDVALEITQGLEMAKQVIANIEFHTKVIQFDFSAKKRKNLSNE